MKPVQKVEDCLKNIEEEYPLIMNQLRYGVYHTLLEDCLDERLKITDDKVTFLRNLMNDERLVDVLGDKVLSYNLDNAKIFSDRWVEH